MSSAAPGRLRDFFSSRTGIAVAVIGALCLAGATAFALRGDEAATEVIPPSRRQRRLSPPRRPQPAGGVLLGASISPEIRSLAAEKSAVEELEQAMGRSLDIHHNFYHVRRGRSHRGRTLRPAVRPDPDDQLERPGRHHRAIADGRYDDLIRQRARGTKALGQPVLIRWFWEMDGKKKAEFAGTPEQYIAAWQHIVGIFRHRRRRQRPLGVVPQRFGLQRRRGPGVLSRPRFRRLDVRRRIQLGPGPGR